ncbi:MAG: hypothetical protein NVS3B10_09100 [Polyangiales bacterium]
MVYQLSAMMRHPKASEHSPPVPPRAARAPRLPGVVLALAFSGALSAACSGTNGGGAAPPPEAPTPTGSTAAAAAPAAAPTTLTAPAKAIVVPTVLRPTKRLTIAEARRYMVALVNRDRATQGLGPVERDEGAPTAAGQAHAEDMAHLGYLGHWGSDGSVPEQRHTEAGGEDMVLENALCFTDEAKRALDAKPTIEPAQVERSESMFFDEVPPNDGHRKNILKPAHTKVGIGVAQPVATATEIPVPCFSQEFTDDYGSYAALPRRAKVGAVVHVEGTLSNGARPSGVGIARIVKPSPIAPSELNKRRSYPVPKAFQMYWGPGFVTPMPVKIDGQKLVIDVPLSDHGQPGLYEVSVWAKLAGSEEHTMVSLRTIAVE